MGKRLIAIVLFVPIAALILASTVFGYWFWRLRRRPLQLSPFDRLLQSG